MNDFVTIKKSIVVRPGFGKEKFILPIGKKLEFLRHEHSYHPYYEVHSYKAFFNVNKKPITITASRIEGSKKITLRGIHEIDKEWSHNTDIYWNEIFEEEFPVKEKK
jgi:hypothetical protein